MHYEISEQFSRESFAVPARAAAYFSDAGEPELRVLLYCCKHASFEEAEMIADLAAVLTEAQVREGMAFWRGAGLFSKSKKRAAAPAERDEAPALKPNKSAPAAIPSARPNYTSMELAAAVEKKPAFSALLDYAQRRLEKNFNGSDIGLLYSFVDYLGLPTDVVMLAIEQCATEGKKSLRYTEKLLIAFADDGIDSYEKAEAYFQARRDYLSFEGKVRALCGFGARSLTAAEKSILATWSEEWKVEFSLVDAAYERTIKAIGKPSLGYMNKVLHTLRESGAKTGADARAVPQDKAMKTYDVNEFFAAAVKRARKKQKEV